MEEIARALAISLRGTVVLQIGLHIHRRVWIAVSATSGGVGGYGNSQTPIVAIMNDHGCCWSNIAPIALLTGAGLTLADSRNADCHGGVGGNNFVKTGFGKANIKVGRIPDMAGEGYNKFRQSYMGHTAGV